MYVVLDRVSRRQTRVHDDLRELRRTRLRRSLLEPQDKDRVAQVGTTIPLAHTLLNCSQLVPIGTDLDDLMQVFESSFDKFVQEVSDTVEDVHSQVRDLGTEAITGLMGSMLEGVQQFITSTFIHLCSC
jgi:hypothetical protein